ncbi:recombinase family protein [Solirhodobacter olei]|uniref:recombinase family protein n=1 Tax=Solirhodobacter olei TaxID=2493082 RepID=UPI000FD6EEEB|nr:recombinase family protein [Solirhodobacter olei]
MRIVAYIRVSTRRQGESGLGIEAQQAEIAAYAATHGASIAAEFIEVESGKKDDRPELHRAIREARLTGSRLVIARLNRLSRNAAFLLNLRDSGVDFVAADMPNANSLTIGVMALVAQEEREAISRNTKAALAAARARGQKLGNPNGAAALRRAGKGNTASRQAATARADARAHDLADVLADITAKGHTTLHQIAKELNRREIRTPRGGRWHPSSVANIRERLAS